MLCHTLILNQHVDNARNQHHEEQCHTHLEISNYQKEKHEICLTFCFWFLHAIVVFRVIEYIAIDKPRYYQTVDEHCRDDIVIHSVSAKVSDDENHNQSCDRIGHEERYMYYKPSHDRNATL